MNTVVYSILLTLLEKRKVTRSFLSEKFEISTRSVSRYIDVLVESGVPVLSSPGMGGGYMLPDDYKLERTYLTKEERERLISMLTESAHTFNDSVNAELLLKLRSFNNTADIPISHERLVIDAGPWGSPHVYKNKIETVNTAMDKRVSLLIKYIDRNEVRSQRLFDPYNLVLKQGVWYIYGWCHERNDYRLFKLSRIGYMLLTEKSYNLRDNADVNEKLRGQFDTFERVDIVVEFSSLILAQIEEWLGVEAVYEDGLSYRAAATVYGGNELVSKILSFGSSIQVISPVALKEEVLIECRRIIESI